MQKPKDISESPGVYQFKDKTGNIIYIGKAKNLKNRVESYFSNNLLPKTAQMMATAESISYIRVTSELEALLLEANLVKKHQPKYNIELKDDKSPLYIGITKDKYPRIVALRKSEFSNYNLQNHYGPFLTGFSSKKVLRLTRKIFPYSTHLPTNKICLYKQLGLCNPCPSEIENETIPAKKQELRKRYLRNVTNVRRILNGKLTFLQKDLEREMKEYSKKQMFEEAKLIAVELTAFKNIAMTKESDIEEYLENPNFAEDLRNEELSDLKNILNGYFPDLTKIERVECFDIAHLSGSFPTASMVTFIDGIADKKYYRHFKIYNKKKNSDVDSMKEVISRRLKHLEDLPAQAGWGKPDLIIIDGGKPQLSAVRELLKEANIPFIGLAKRFETIVVMKNNKFFEVKPAGGALNLLQRIRDEAHRFARRLHHKLISQNLTN